jgi:Uma2 family endonuclease
MASTTSLTVEEYLSTAYEYEPEFVDGEIIERAMPTVIHAWLTHLLSLRLHGAGFCLIDCRMRPAKDTIRIPDLSVFHEFPAERVPSSPPFVALEIISPDDRHEDLLRKLQDYRAWGVEHIWVVEPRLKEFHVFDSQGLREVKAFEIPGLRIDAAELFAEALKPSLP